MHFALCKEQQHSQKKKSSSLWCSWRSSGVPSRLVWLYVFFSLSLFILFAHLVFPFKFLYSWGYSAVSEIIRDVLSGGGWCLFCSARTFIIANSTPLISISRHLAPFEKLGRKVITLKGLFESSAPVHLWASKRSKIVDPASQYFSGGSG
jgi:hypothetical protein